MRHRLDGDLCPRRALHTLAHAGAKQRPPRLDDEGTRTPRCEDARVSDDIEEEPAKRLDWQPTNRLFQQDNVIITPHAAYYSEESIHAVREIAANEVVRVLTGQHAFSPVNFVGAEMYH
jgi:hypothetical protein